MNHDVTPYALTIEATLLERDAAGCWTRGGFNQFTDGAVESMVRQFNDRDGVPPGNELPNRAQMSIDGDRVVMRRRIQVRADPNRQGVSVSGSVKERV